MNFGNRTVVNENAFSKRLALARILRNSWPHSCIGPLRFIMSATGPPTTTRAPDSPNHSRVKARAFKWAHGWTIRTHKGPIANTAEVRVRVRWV